MRLTLSIAIVVLARQAIPQSPADLAITHARVLNVRSGTVANDRTVVVRDGVITWIAPSTSTQPRARLVVDAKGRLLTPGFVDAHFHMCSIYRPACTNPRDGRLALVMSPDSIRSYQRYLASLYLPYGVTTVRDVGSEERVLPLLLAWMKRTPDAPNYYPVGADLISPDPNHIPAPWQVEVGDSAAAAAKVREYYARGIRNIKLYWRLHEPAFKGGLLEAQRLGMNVTGHVDFRIVPVDRALDLGLRNFEHMLAWPLLALGPVQVDAIFQDVGRRVRTRDGQLPGFYYLAVPEQWNAVRASNPVLLDFVKRFKSVDASMTPTLHVFAQRYGLTYFTSRARDLNEDASRFSKADLARAVAGYKIMASYVKQLHDAGVRLSIGTDTPEPGKSVLSEMLLLHDAGISMADVFRIATLESATNIGHGSEYGAIEPGKRADLVLFDGDPLARPLDLIGPKSVFKDGVPVRASAPR